MTKTAALLTVLAVLGLAACGRKGEPLRLVCVVDMSASIDEPAREEAIAALERAFAGLRRGDSVAVVPITGDAAAESAGRVLRYEVGTRREAYDEDLARLARRIADDLGRLRREAVERPAKRSDVLGAVGIAAEELALAPAGARRVLVVLSDLVQDDRRSDFKLAREMGDAGSARALAERLGGGGRLGGARVYLGTLRSADLKAMPEARREAVREFWAAYARSEGAAAVEVYTDGAGQLDRYVRALGERS